MSNEYVEEHKILHKKIYDCKCKPVTEEYCNDCKNAVIEFMRKHGAGSLTQDVRIERLNLEILTLTKTNKSIKNQLEQKTIRVNKLKKELELRGENEKTNN